MESNEKQVKYANILDIIDGMKQDIVNTSMQQLLMTGAMPEIAQNELKVLSQITGAVFNGMISLGTEVYEDENNSGLVYTKISGKKYSCAKINISNSVSITSKPLSASEAYSMTANSVENVGEEPIEETAKKVSIEEFEEPKTNENIVNDNSTNNEVLEKNISNNIQNETFSTPIEETNESDFVESNYSFTPSQLDEASEFGNSEPANNQDENENVEEPTYQEPPMTNNYEEPIQNQVEESIDDLLGDDDFGDIEPTPTPTPVQKKNSDDVKVSTPIDISAYELTNESYEEPSNSNEEEQPPVVEKAEVKTFARNDMWEEESCKDVNTMIYNMSKLNVCHINGGKPEEITVMIAPLKISRVSAPAVPIIVTLFNRGKIVTKSSFDMGEGGKSIVTLEINEFYFLCRGSFDEEGKFKAFITTTGPSSQQGDRINVVSSKNYGNSHDPETKNGHVKMKYQSESGEGTVEVFPFGTSSDNEFVIMVKNPEFCDTYYIDQNGRTGTSTIIYGADCKLEIVPNWNGDILEVEIFEK